MPLGGVCPQISTAVGYSADGLSAGNQQMVGSQFRAVAGGDLDITSIKVSADDDFVDGEFTMEWYNPETFETTTAQWVELFEDEENLKPLGYSGWGDPMTWMPISKTFILGEGYWISNIHDDLTAPKTTAAGSVVVAGESDETIDIPLSAGNQQIVACPYPSGNLEIAKIVVDADDDFVDGEFTMEWYNPVTFETTAAQWVELFEDEENLKPLGYSGWGDPMTWMPVDKEFKNGEGFWISNIHEDLPNPVVQFPNPFFKTAE